MRFSVSALFVVIAATFVAANPLDRRQEPDIPCNLIDPTKPVCPETYRCCRGVRPDEN
ncbi:hypothetical protein Moror_10410, partial [Moniliophthora roreri MCA 2997]